METERITLSQRERDRLRVLHEVQQKQITQIAAAKRLKISDRLIRRLLVGLGEHGDRAVMHGSRGRRSNRRFARRLDGSHLATLPRPLPAPLPSTLRPSASPSGLRPAGLAEQTPKPKYQIKPKYHVPAHHPREETVEPDISMLRKTGHFYFALTRIAG